jgi:hypothetical protein
VVLVPGVRGVHRTASGEIVGPATANDGPAPEPATSDDIEPGIAQDIEPATAQE